MEKERRQDSVCKKDFTRLEGKVDAQGLSIDKLMEIYPVLKESVELKKSVNNVVNWSVKVAKIAGVLLGVIGTAVGIVLGIRQLFK